LQGVIVVSFYAHVELVCVSAVAGSDPFDAARRKRVHREGDRAASTKLKAKKGDHLHLGGSGEGGSGGASCSFQHSGSGINTGPSAIGERPSGGRQHLPPTCYPSAGARKKMVPPSQPLPDEKRRFQLFTASDNADSNLGVTNEGHGTKLRGIKLEQQQQQQQDTVPAPQQAAPSSNQFPGNILAVTGVTRSFQQTVWNINISRMHSQQAESGYFHLAAQSCMCHK